MAARSRPKEDLGDPRFKILRDLRDRLTEVGQASPSVLQHIDGGVRSSDHTGLLLGPPISAHPVMTRYGENGAVSVSDGVDCDDFEALMAAGLGSMPPPAIERRFDHRGLLVTPHLDSEAPTPKKTPGELLYYNGFRGGDIFNAKDIARGGVREAVFSYLKGRAEDPHSSRFVAVFTGNAEDNPHDDLHPELLAGALIGRLQVFYLVVAAKYNIKWKRYQLELAHPSVRWKAFEVVMGGE